MAVFMNLLYGEMVASALFHMAIPFLISLFIIKFMMYNSPMQRNLMLIGITVGVSVLLHLILLSMVQISSCGTIQNMWSIFQGSVIGAAIVGGMIAIPTFVQPMHLMVSQLFGPHLPLLTPELAAVQKSAIDIAGASLPADIKIATDISYKALTQDEYDLQVFREIAYGVGFWGAFGGAYGVGIGSLFASRCSKSADQNAAASGGGLLP